MAPLDPESGKAAAPLVGTALENGVGYLITAVLTWVASRLNVGKKINALDRNLTKKLDAFKEEMMLRQSELESQIASMAQELYGAKGNGGMIKSLELVQADVAALNERSAGMDAKLDILIKRGGL